MSRNIFFEQKGPFLLNVLFPHLKLKKKIKIFDIKNLEKATSIDLTFLDNTDYINLAKSTKASYCLTTEKLKEYLPKHCVTILVNTIIEQNVTVGDNCVIGSQIVIRNSLIGKGVVIQDGCKIGLKGFGFIPIKEKNLRFPHIGKVLIKDNAEIGANCTIDRGSINDTEIGQNTFLDNQVHVAHNIKIGNNCMIAGQVGFAGSSVIGDSVSIGGQAGVSGHLKIGNNVKIGGGSGVVKDIQDGSIVMGYPAVSLKDFIRSSKK